MRHLLIIVCCIFFDYPNAQSQGFNNTYDISQRAVGFTNISVSNDTISIIGLNYDTIFPYLIGICFVQLDTFGHIIHQKSHYTNEDFWSPTNKQGFVKLKDHKGYAIIGTHFDSQRGYLLRLDEHGDLIYLRRYLKGNFLTNYWHNIIEVPGGFLVALHKQKLDYDNDCFLYKLDYTGNILWQVSIGDEKTDYTTDLYMAGNNEYVVSGAAVINIFTPDQLDDRGGTRLTGVDSSGNIIWSWTGPMALDESGGGKGTHRLDNGDWLYATFQSVLIDQNWYQQPKFIRRDSNFNLIWEKEYGYPGLNEGGFQDFKPYPGGGYVATGYLTNGPFETGFICRVDDDCNPVWERRDTGFYAVDHAFNVLAASDFLSSGSIIACGQTVNYDEEKSYGWLLKITPDGCIDTLFCNPIVATPPEPSVQQTSVRIYPNPSNNQIIFSKIPPGVSRLEIFNLQGAIIKNMDLTDDQDSIVVDVSAFPDGIFFCLFYNEKGIISSGKFLVQH